jgi:hypothetical protein
MRNRDSIKRETDMYGAVKAYLKKERGCKHVSADDGGQRIHLLKNLSKRDPDVVGVAEGHDVHIAEGKFLARSGHSFDECVSQAESLRPFADYLYVFFPSEEWSSLSPEDVQRNTRSLKARGMGLLLVEERGKCTEILHSGKNAEVEDRQRDVVLERMGVLKDVPKPAYLSSTQASDAIAIVDCFMECGRAVAAEAIRNVFGKKVKWNPQVPKEKEVPRGFFFFADIGSRSDGSLKNFGVDLDVFGGHLGDGHSCIWVTRRVTCATVLQRLETRSAEFGTHLYFEENDSARSLGDISPEQVRKHRDGYEFWLMHRVDFFGRSRGGLRTELEGLLTAAKSLK